MMLQLNPPIPVWVPSRNQSGFCVGWIDYTQEHDTLWKTILADGTIWDLPQSEVRGIENTTMGRPKQPEVETFDPASVGYMRDVWGDVDAGPVSKPLPPGGPL